MERIKLTPARRELCIRYYLEYQSNGGEITNKMYRENPFKGFYKRELLEKAMRQASLRALLDKIS